MRAKIERREFITLLGGAAAAWPLPARAQQMARLPTVGFLGAGSPATADVWVSAFTSRLRELGWIEDRNIKIEVRWAEGRSDRSAEIATELVRLKVDVIVTYSTEHTQIAKQATSIIPIVFALAADPGMKLVTSPRSTDPMIYRARRMPRLEIRPSGRTLRGYFSSARRGAGVEQDLDPHTCRSRNPPLEDPIF